MIVDKNYCMSSFLIYRAIVDQTKVFNESFPTFYFKQHSERYHIDEYEKIDYVIREVIENALSDGKCALMLSSGIDSAILAKYLPKGTLAYTLRCQAPDALDETVAASEFAAECGLEHKIIDVSWDDYNYTSPMLMKHKGAPIHSIEPQIYKAALQAKKDGVRNLIFGENADIIFGGMDGLLSRDWLFDEFVNRYMYLNPQKILKEGEIILEPFEKYRKGSEIDYYGFTCEYFYNEANGSYENACTTAGVKYISPFNKMILDMPLDFKRIRNGEPKYLLRELFKSLYLNHEMPPKIPMPRAVDYWLKDWKGPERDEFIPNCTYGFDGNKKWMVYILEMFLNMMDGEDFR